MSDNYNISDLTVATPYGSLDKKYGDAMRGLSRVVLLDTREAARDNIGFTFFVRPMLNLSEVNLNRDRVMKKLLQEKSITDRYVRMMFDRLLYFNENLDCPVADNLQAFIPIFSNNLESISGFVDPTVDSYISPQGSRKQQYALLDGTDQINEIMDLNVVYKNTYEDAIVTAFTIWLRYIVNVKQGLMVPYTGFIGRRLIDYQSRIFRLVTTEDRRYVKRIAATGPMYPDVNSVGKYFDVPNSTTIYNEMTRTHTVRFKCIGVEYNDPILIREFNRTVGFFNPIMRKINEGASPESVGMVKLSPEGENKINYNGYPRINEKTNEIEWYVIGAVERI
jgi:hypothetical protein